MPNSSARAFLGPQSLSWSPMRKSKFSNVFVKLVSLKNWGLDPVPDLPKPGSGES